MSEDIVISVSGKNRSGKTCVAYLIKRLLEEAADFQNVEVECQDGDFDKYDNDDFLNQAMEIVKGRSIVILDNNFPRIVIDSYPGN